MIITRERLRPVQLRNLENHAFRAAVLRGLGAPAKELPCKYFYDEAGSALFERITRLQEYYLTRAELSIMQRHAGEMAALAGPRCLLIEYGSGSSTKTRLLLDHLGETAGYVPIDVSQEYLCGAAAALACAYPELEVLPVCGDFTRPLALPFTRNPPARKLVYFPGSTIGNFTPGQMVSLLGRTRKICGLGGALLLGADLQKDSRVIERAYNDAQGVTAAFNLNLLVRINRELGADFAVEKFNHCAFFNEAESRIEMHLVSKQDQQVHIGLEEIEFVAGESIRTEFSYKFTPEELRERAEAAGFEVQRMWLDERRFFSVHFFTVKE